MRPLAFVHTHIHRFTPSRLLSFTPPQSVATVRRRRGPHPGSPPMRRRCVHAHACMHACIRGPQPRAGSPPPPTSLLLASLSSREICALYPVPCALYHASCALYHAPCALYHAPCALYHAPCALYHAPCAHWTIRQQAPPLHAWLTYELENV